VQTQLEAWLLCGNTPSWTDTRSLSGLNFVLQRGSGLVAAAAAAGFVVVAAGFVVAAAAEAVEGLVPQAGEAERVADSKP